MIRLVSILLIFATAEALPEVRITHDRLQELADEVNAKQTTWTAGINFHRHEETLDLSHTVGVILQREPKIREKGQTSIDCENKGLPVNFDARKHWPKCSSTLEHVYDQGHCGSCWAVSVISVFTDRLCIKSNGQNSTLRSAQQITSCCHKCGHGCGGGWPLAAWTYLMREGETTGGDFNSKQGCQPYLIPPCAHHVNGTELESCTAMKPMKTPKCKLHCYNKNYRYNYDEDRTKALSAYELDPCEAQNDILEKGPIVAAFAVFEDFLNYKSGVYKHVTGKLVGYHAVRVIGWGVEENTPYWLVVNSWNRSWGDNGYFKVLRGSDEVKFEEYLVAGDV